MWYKKGSHATETTIELPVEESGGESNGETTLSEDTDGYMLSEANPEPDI